MLTVHPFETNSFPENHLERSLVLCLDDEFYDVLRLYNDPDDEYCLPLYSSSTLVIGKDIKQEKQLIPIDFSSQCFQCSACNRAIFELVFFFSPIA
jgi:hypothetical protein